jgi:hypothetical protein
MHPRFGAPLVYLQNDEPLVLPPAAEPRADEKETKKEEREPAPAAGSAVSSVASRPMVAETPAAVAPAPAAKDQDAASSSFKVR